MKIIGIVKDASKELPIEGAKIGLFIKERELAVFYSDRDGRFEHKEAAQYIGESLICNVEKEGYKFQDITYKIESEEVQLDIELVPLAPEPKEMNELTIRVKDKQNNLLEGVEITLEAEGEQIGAGFSDKTGLFKTDLAHDLKDKTITYKAKLGGFELVSGQIQLRKETTLEVIMEKLPKIPKPRKWIKIAVIVGAVIIAAIIVYFLIPRKPLQINSFRASKTTIKKGEQSTLSWKTSNAVDVKILPDVGGVGTSGSKAVSPSQSTTYTLIAKSKKGKSIEKTVPIQVSIIPPPQIISFSASPSTIKKGEQSTLSWKTSNAVDVKILPNVGGVSASGSKTVNPSQTITYTLIAKNQEGNTVEKTVPIRVLIPAPLPQVIDFRASNTTIKKGEQSTLSWKTANAIAVQISPDVGSVSASGSKTVSPSQSTTYKLIAKNKEGKMVEKTVPIQVLIPAILRIVSFKASITTIKIGEQSTLSWETSNAVDVQISPDVGRVSISGSKTVSPCLTTTYTLIAKNKEGKRVESQIQIRVTIPSPAYAKYWVALPPYNVLWPLWSPALSPTNPIIGISTPVVSELSRNTILPIQPVIALNPCQPDGSGMPWLIYNTPPVFGGGLLFYDPSDGLNPWPPNYLLDPVTGTPAPIALPKGWSVISPAASKRVKQYLPLANEFYSKRYGVPITGLLRAVDIL